MFECKLCEDSHERFKTIEGLYSHLERKHNDEIPPDWSVEQFAYYLKTGKKHGTCVICKGKTKFNPKTGKYYRLCENPKCKEKNREIFEKRMIGKYGKVSLLDDPEQQKKMLANRSISGEYTWSDGSKKTYTGSYEYDFLRFLDVLMDYPSRDVITPSPHTYYYEYEGKKHFYIPDVYIESLNLEIEIKDGGDNPNTHHKIQDVDKVKERLKDQVLLSQTSVSYIKITNKSYDTFMKYLMELKNQYNKLDKREKFTPIFILAENYNEEILGEIVTEADDGTTDYTGTTDSPDEHSSSVYYACDTTGLKTIKPTKDANGNECIYASPFKEYAATKGLKLNNSQLSITSKVGEEISMNVKLLDKEANVDRVFFVYELKGEGFTPVTTNGKESKTVYMKKGHAEVNREFKIKNYRKYIKRFPNVKCEGFPTDKQMKEKEATKESFDALDALLYSHHLAQGMRDATSEEQKSVMENIKNISEETGVNFYDEVEESAKKNDLHGISPSKKFYILPFFEMLNPKNFGQSPMYNGKFKEARPRIMKKISWCESQDDIKYLLRDASYGINQLTKLRNDLDHALKNPDDNKSKYVELRKRNKKGLTVQSIDEHIKWIKEDYRPAIYAKKEELAGVKESIEMVEEGSKVVVKENDKKIHEDNLHLEKEYGILVDGKYNAIAQVKGYNFKCRGRSELLVIKGDSVYLAKGKEGLYGNYSVPGGGWDPKEPHDISAIREAEEEARLSTKNVQYGGNYLTEYSEPHKWVQEKIPKKDQWRGYYTEVYIGEYTGKFNGHIDEEDKDDIINIGKFYPISEVRDILNPVHRRIIDAYIQQRDMMKKAPSHLYRVTYEGDGVYEAFRKNVTFEEWKQFKESKAANWLPIPTNYGDYDVSYFTEEGFKKFRELVLPIFERKLDTDKIIANKIKTPSGAITYSDKYQYVISPETTKEACKNPREARRFVQDVAKLAKKYDANYFLVTDGASGTNNNGNPAVKVARDAVAKWERENGFDDKEDWRDNPDDFSKYRLKESLELVEEEAHYSSTDKYPVFIVLMHTGTSIASAIKAFTHDEFSHACISFNSKLDPLYSFGRKKLDMADSGFVVNSPKADFFTKFHTYYSVYVMYVNKKSIDAMKHRLEYFIKNEDNLKFDNLNMIGCGLGISSEKSKKYFCSRFCMEIIGQGVELEKVPSLYRPQDMSELDNISLVNKGADFYNYDYKETERNLKKIKKGSKNHE